MSVSKGKTGSKEWASKSASIDVEGGDPTSMRAFKCSKNSGSDKEIKVQKKEVECD